MISFDEEQVLKECSTENPCGDNLEYSWEFLELERCAKYIPEQGFGESVIEESVPNWREVEKFSSQLLKKTKDLRIAVLLAQASLNNGGFVGFANGLSIIDKLLSRYWDCVHPQLDPEDNKDPTQRINTVAALADLYTVRNARRTPLALTRLLELSLHDLEDDGNFEYKHLLEAIPYYEIETLLEAVTSCLEYLEHIITIFKVQAPSLSPPDLSPIQQVLLRVQKEFAKCKSSSIRGAAQEALPSSHGSSDSTEESAATADANVESLVQNELAKLSLGYIVSNFSKRMKVGISERIEVRVAQQYGEDLYRTLKGKGVAKIEEIKIGTYMKVRLSGEKFGITPLNSEEQLVTSGEYTEWAWNVKPLAPGKQVLHLLVTVKIVLPFGEKVKDHPVLDKEVIVSVNLIYTIKTFVFTYWKWLVTAILIPLIGWLWQVIKI